MYECFHCGQRSVIWQNDFTFADFGYEGEGIVHVCHCSNCGANIEYYVPLSDDNDANDNKETE
jgi:transcription elongation factor Elf1